MRAFVIPLCASVIAGCVKSSEPLTCGCHAYAAQAAAVAEDAEPPTPPVSARQAVIDTIFGTPVPDPYRWLEDLDSPDTRTWVEGQNAASRAWLDAVPEREGIKDRLTELWNYERWGVPKPAGDQWVFSYNDGLSNQPVWRVTDDLGSEGRVLLDANTLSEDGTVAIASVEPGPVGKHVAYAIAEAGSDWRTWKVRTLDGIDLDDELRWVKFSGVSWLPDGSGLFYSRFPAAEGDFEDTLAFQKVYFHRLGTPQSDDVLVYEDPEQPEWGFDAEVDEEGERLVIHVTQGTEEKSRVYLIDLDDVDLVTPGGTRTGPVTKVLDGFDADYGPVGWHAGRLLLRTDNQAPRGRVISVDPAAPAESAWTEVIPESPDTLRRVSFIGGHLVATYLSNASTRVRVFTADGAHVRDVKLPGIGSGSGFAGAPDEPDTFYSYSSYAQPTTVYRYDVEAGTSEVFRAPSVSFDPTDYVTDQVWYDSADGTKVPMFISRKAGVEPNGELPTLLYGYGGFNIAITPSFKVANLAWMERGGVFAVANLRGGGEFGRDWHQAGTQQNKQNVFDDFIAAAEHLIETGWTRSDRLAIHGRSNGGLLVGAVMTQRPDLFGAAIPGVGVLDMLRYHRFTIGWAWASDYGTVEESEDMFRYLLRYSPVHNARQGTAFPPTLVMTADHDDRVVPAHSYKFTAALQHAHRGDDPVLIRIETRAGHGAGTPTHMKIEELADKLAFMVATVGGAAPVEE